MCQINKDWFSKYAAHAYSILMWINLRCQVTFFLTYCDAVLRHTLIMNSRVFNARRLSVTRSTKLTSARALFVVNKAAWIFGAVAELNVDLSHSCICVFPTTVIFDIFQFENINKAVLLLRNSERFVILSLVILKFVK